MCVAPLAIFRLLLGVFGFVSQCSPPSRLQCALLAAPREDIHGDHELCFAALGRHTRHTTLTDSLVHIDEVAGFTCLREHGVGC